MRQTLCGLLQTCAAEPGGDEDLLRQLRQAAASFNSISEVAAKGQGAARLSFYLLPAMPLAALFRTAFPQAAPDAPAADGTNGLLAVLSPL